MANQIQVRRDTSANWTSVNPILADGEQGLETDTGKVKYGNGNDAWSALSYFGGSGYDDTAIQAEVDLNTLKETNISHPLVETAVPLGAVFTDTIYDDTAIQGEVDLNTAKVTFPEASIDTKPYARQDAGWVEIVSSGGGATAAYKTADETKTNDATPTLDSDLQVTLEPNSVNILTVILWISADAIPDFKYGFEFPADYVGKYAYGIATGQNSTFPMQLTQGSAGSGTGLWRTVYIYINISTVTGGTFGVKWSQLTSDANATILRKGSSIQLTKLN